MLSPPKPVSLSTDYDNHLVEMPAITRTWTSPSKVCRYLGTELEKPTPDRFAGNVYTVPNKDFFYITEGKCEPCVQADWISVHPWWETMALE